MTNRSIKTIELFTCLLAMLALAACSTAPTTPQGRADIKADASNTLAKAKTSDASLEAQLSRSAGYAVFPSIGKGAVAVGGAYGRGVLYQGGSGIGFCSMSQVTIGFQFGGQAYSEILVFATPDALNRFKGGNFAFAAQATAVALKSGAAANAKFEHGVAVFTLDHSGLMYEASVGGQKFNCDPIHW